MEISRTYERQRSMMAVAALCCMLATLGLTPERFDDFPLMTMREMTGFLAGFTGMIVLVVELARGHNSGEHDRGHEG